MFLSSIGAPVVTIVAFSNFSCVGRVLDEHRPPCPRPRSTALPGSRVTICACRSSGKLASSGLRMLPWLSWRRNSTYSGLSSVALRDRDRVDALERLAPRPRCARPWPPGSVSRATASSRILPGDALGRVADRARSTSASLNSSAVSGRDGARRRRRGRRSFFSTAFHCAMFSGVKSSLTVWPSSIVTSVSIAWPPNSFW